METIKTILSLSFLFSLAIMTLIVVSYMVQEYRKQNPGRRHKRIQKIVDRYRQTPVERGYSTPEGYMKKVELMDLRGDLNQNEYYAQPKWKISGKHRAV